MSEIASQALEAAIHGVALDALGRLEDPGYSREVVPDEEANHDAPPLLRT